ncbi:hypothetical protein JB92DRAFT_2717926 [Gautieria morchelliformis]|nr:hypothetical protein JB92DRAFT_2717926 [Gautieria morchelliformis]
MLTLPLAHRYFPNWGLLGVKGNQVYIYHLCFPRDSRYIKSLGALHSVLFILEVAQTRMISSHGWQWLITSWGQPGRTEDYHQAWFDICILAGVLSTSVQIFFA